MGARCDACAAWMQMPRKQRVCPAAREESYLSFIVHPTDGVLSQKRDLWVWTRLDMMHSSSGQLRDIPDSSGLLMIRVPALKSSFNFCGNPSCQMIGPILFKPDSQNPPAPILQLSEYPM